MLVELLTIKGWVGKRAKLFNVKYRGGVSARENGQVGYWVSLLALL